MRRVLFVILFLALLFAPLNAGMAQVITDTAWQWKTPSAPPASGFDWDWVIITPPQLGERARLGDPQAQAYALWEDSFPAEEKDAWLDGLRTHRADSAAGISARMAVAAFAAGNMTATRLRPVLAAAASTDVAAAISLATLDSGGEIVGDMGDMGWLQRQIDIGTPAAMSAACRLAIAPRHLIRNFFPACWTQADRDDAEAAWRVALVLLGRADDFEGALASRIAEALNVKRDPVAAVRFLTQAAAIGHAGALGRLAHLKAIGEGTPKNAEEALRLASRASGLGNAEGMAVLGLLKLRQKSNHTEAVALLQSAAHRGNRMAQYTLATLALRGQASPRDFTAALTWLHLLRLDRRTDPPPERYGDLMLEPWPRTIVVGNAVRTEMADLDARIRAAQLRKDLADSGEWPLVDPVPAALPPRNADGDGGK